MYKQAQNYVDDDQLVVVMPQFEDLEVSSEDNDEDEDNLVVFPDEEAIELPELEEVSSGDAPSMEISFSLPRLPGADDHELEVSLDDDEEDEEKDSKKDKEPGKDWQGIPKSEFLPWMRSYLDKIPKHKGETLALERAHSYLKRGLDHLSKAVQSDYDGEIDISKADDARSEMESGMSRLDKELMKRRKKASDERASMTKEGQKAMGVNSGGVMVQVPLLISAIARACVNSVITNGKDLETTFNKLAVKYKLDDREKMETIQLLMDMNMPISRDLNLLNDDAFGYTSEDNISSSPNYHA